MRWRVGGRKPDVWLRGFRWRRGFMSVTAVVFMWVKNAATGSSCPRRVGREGATHPHAQNFLKVRQRCAGKGNAFSRFHGVGLSFDVFRTRAGKKDRARRSGHVRPLPGAVAVTLQRGRWSGGSSPENDVGRLDQVSHSIGHRTQESRLPAFAPVRPLTAANIRRGRAARCYFCPGAPERD